MKLSARKKAAKKAAKTRAINAAWKTRWETIDSPAEERMLALANHLAAACGRFQLKWSPLREYPARLKGGVEQGTLVKFLPGRMVRVLPYGYKRPKDYHWSYWEPLI